LAIVVACCSYAATLQAVLAEPPDLPNPEISARAFVDQSQIVSKYTTELYAHQTSMRIVAGIGYVAYQCNETSVEENVAGEIVRLAIFNILNPTATAHWVDVALPGETSGDITITGKAVASPMLHTVDDDTLRLFFGVRLTGDSSPLHRILYRDYTISTGALSPLKQVRCTIAKKPGEQHDLALEAVQSHLSFLFGDEFGKQFAMGISNTCDMHEFDGALYSTIQMAASTLKCNG
jgi:hypothetical protein